MYRGFILLRTDNKKIKDFFEDIFKDIPILIKINENVNVKELLESSIKAVLLDADCKDSERLFNEFSKRDVGIISIGKDADMKWPFNKEDILKIIEKTEVYIPEIKKFNIKLNLSEVISSLKKKSLDRKKINEEIIKKYLESNKGVKDDDKKSLSNILKSKLDNQLISEKVDKDKEKEVKKSDLKTKVSGFFSPFKEKGLKRKKSKEAIVKEFLDENKKDSKILEKRKKDERIIEDLVKLSTEKKDVEKVTVSTEKINSEPEKTDFKSKNMSILVLEIKDEEEFNY